MPQKEYDWTVDPITHRSNSSPFFHFMTERVNEMILNSARDIVQGRTRNLAGLILAQLTHEYGFVPTRSHGDILTELGLHDTKE